MHTEQLYVFVAHHPNTDPDSLLRDEIDRVALQIARARAGGDTTRTVMGLSDYPSHIERDVYTELPNGDRVFGSRFFYDAWIED